MQKLIYEMFIIQEMTFISVFRRSRLTRNIIRLFFFFTARWKIHFSYAGPAEPDGKITSYLPPRPVRKIISFLPVHTGVPCRRRCRAEKYVN